MSHSSNHEHERWRSLGGSYTRRTATEADLDAIVEIVMAGFTDDPDTNYRFPLRNLYPKDYEDRTKKTYLSYIQQPEKLVVQVVVTTKPIAVAVWDVAVLTPPKRTLMRPEESRDINQERCTAFNKAADRCFKEHLASYAEKQMHLWVIVTHPAFRNCGAATLLMQYGLDNTGHWPVTLFASPMGRRLYERLRFACLGTEKVQVPGEQATLTFAVMVHDPSPPPQRPPIRLESYRIWP